MNSKYDLNWTASFDTALPKNAGDKKSALERLAELSDRPQVANAIEALRVKHLMTGAPHNKFMRGPGRRSAFTLARKIAKGSKSDNPMYRKN